MPPLPTNGTSYPPSSSGYQPLQPDDDVESPSDPLTSSCVRQRTFALSPYRSRANDPTDLLQTFLADTRSAEHAKDLSLRVTIETASRTKRISLPLPSLTVQDSLPFAVADDVPCLRGPAWGARTWRESLRGVVDEVTNTSARREKHARLQVWNATQNRPLYASQEEVARHQARLKTGTLPPWTPLNDDFLPQPSLSSSEEARHTEDEVDKLFESGSMADFDLSSVFARTRQRKTSRLVSSGLQEAVERFADDRHFSKHLRCREVVWGWDLGRLRKSLRELAKQRVEKGKGKARQEEEEIKVEVEVVGLDAGPAYHVVWAPIASLTGSRMFDSRASLVSVMIISTLLLGGILFGIISNTLVIIAALLAVLAWGTLMWLIRTRNRCVFDTIGSAWCLTPRWIKLTHANPEWDHATVMESLRETGKASEIAKRGEEWFVRRGMDQEEWLSMHRERLLHWLQN